MDATVADILQCIFPQISAFLLWRLKNQPLGRNSSLETLNIDTITSDSVVKILEYRLYGVIQDVVFTHQPHFSCSFLSLICLSTNQNIQLIHSLLIRIEWTTGNGILMSSSHWSIYIKLYPGCRRLLSM